MCPLRYSINVTLDGCCDHREGIADEDLHRHAMENIVQADALLFGRVTYEMMEAAWRLATRTVAMPDWTEPFARTIDAAKKYVVSSTLDRVDWNAELIRGDLGQAIQQLKQQPGKGLFTGGVTLPVVPRPMVARAVRHLLGSYRIATAPEPNSSRSTSFKSTRFESPANNVGPWPASLGCTTNSYSSINPSSVNASGSVTPPVNSPLPGSCLSC